MGRVTSHRRVRHLAGATHFERPETVVVEEPLEIRVNGSALTVTMRTPGSDIELAQGFLLTEAVIGHRDDVASARYCRGADADDLNTYNVLDVTLAPQVPPPSVDVTRNFYTTSSCGVCGKASLDAVRLVSRHSPGDDPCVVAAAALSAMPAQLRRAQKVFATTGGLHGAALFDTSGAMLAAREDVGRHNAVDKVIGSRLLAGESPATACLVISGRAGFELVQKAVATGMGSLVAVGAPTSLSVQLAREAGLVLYGFTGADRCVRYA